VEPPGEAGWFILAQTAATRNWSGRSGQASSQFSLRNSAKALVNWPSNELPKPTTPRRVAAVNGRAVIGVTPEVDVAAQHRRPLRNPPARFSEVGCAH
jgi:hypothetical protein